MKISLISFSRGSGPPLNGNRNPERWEDFSQLVKIETNQISRCITVQSPIEILIGFEFRGMLRYTFKLRFLFNLNLQLTKISPPFRISICISCTISVSSSREQAVPEPRGYCFKLRAIKSRSCFRHSPRSHIGDALWNSEPDSRQQFSQCFWSAFLVFRKCVFVQKVLNRIIQNTPRKDPVFGHMEVQKAMIVAKSEN